MKNLDLILLLANSRKPRKPSGSRVRAYDDPLADTKSTVAFFGSIGCTVRAGFPGMPGSVNEDVMVEMRRLREAVEKIVETVVSTNEKGGNPSDALLYLAGALGVLNGFSSECPWIKALAPDMGIVETPVRFNPVGLLAAKCIEELAGGDLTRIKRCERPQCGLFFYDTTRNRSARWHAENPCGWRTRSGRRHKTSHG
jgi:predicted RNA-binding Zn ribbon-like protein